MNDQEIKKLIEESRCLCNKLQENMRLLKINNIHCCITGLHCYNNENYRKYNTDQEFELEFKAKLEKDL